jgi:DNA-directed RNA polymerase specialized sigma24 family protein
VRADDLSARHIRGGGNTRSSVSLLSGRWQLEDVGDVEALVATLARDVAADLQWHEREDLVAYLLGLVWERHEKWDREKTPSFRQFATYLLRLRIVDHCRQQRGRTRWTFSSGYTYERVRPELVSLEFPVGDGELELGEVVAARTGDPQTDCDPDLSRLLGGGSRQRAQDLDALGIEPPRRVA